MIPTWGLNMSTHKFSNLLVILTLIVATTFNSCADKSIRGTNSKGRDGSNGY